MLLFVFFNTVLPICDVGTDGFTYMDLLKYAHIKWASLTMYFMWNSFVLHLSAFIYKALQSACGKNPNFQFQKELVKVVIHIPFAMPVKNVYNAHLLYRMRYGTKDFEEKNWRAVEEIQQEAGISTMYESFTEAGPQSVVQLVVVLSTGRISWAQRFSIPFSILSLAWSSSRVFFILRTPNDRDPNPDVMMILMRILPWELIIVTNRILLWTLIGGLLGGYTFAGLLFSFIILLTLLHITERRKRAPGIRPSLGSKEDFKLMSALTSLWLPCLVGEWKSNFFLVSAITSTVNKILLLAVAFLLAYYTDLNDHPFLLWCHRDTHSPGQRQDDVKHCQFPQTDKNYTSCWNPDAKDINQMVRVCGSEESEVTLLAILLGVLAVSTALTIWAVIHLHQVSNYFKFFMKTKRFLCFETKPILHRSTVFALSADKEKEKELRELLETNDTTNCCGSTIKQDFQTEVNRTRQGETPLHVASKANNTEGTIILLKAGAIPKENYENSLPLIDDHLDNPEVLEKLQESKDKQLVPNHILIGLRRQLKGREETAQQKILLDLVGEGDHLAKCDVSLWDYTNKVTPKEIRIKAYQFLEVNYFASCSYTHE